LLLLDELNDMLLASSGEEIIAELARNGKFGEFWVLIHCNFHFIALRRASIAGFCAKPSQETSE